jgi:hypothetical protein
MAAEAKTKFLHKLKGLDRAFISVLEENSVTEASDVLLLSDEDWDKLKIPIGSRNRIRAIAQQEPSVIFAPLAPTHFKKPRPIRKDDSDDDSDKDSKVRSKTSQG